MKSSQLLLTPLLVMVVLFNLSGHHQSIKQDTTVVTDYIDNAQLDNCCMKKPIALREVFTKSFDLEINRLASEEPDNKETDWWKTPIKNWVLLGLMYYINPDAITPIYYYEAISQSSSPIHACLRSGYVFISTKIFDLIYPLLIGAGCQIIGKVDPFDAKIKMCHA